MDCEGCKIISGKSTNPIHEKLININGMWILCHSGESTSYLGHLILTPREHRTDWVDLTAQEATALVPIVQIVDSALKSYWQETFSDPIERLYLAYFNDAATTDTHHFHVHLFPRTKSMPKGIAWDVGKIKKDVDIQQVNKLMDYIIKKFQPPSTYSDDFKWQFVQQFGMPIKNFRNFV